MCKIWKAARDVFHVLISSHPKRLLLTTPYNASGIRGSLGCDFANSAQLRLGNLVLHQEWPIFPIHVLLPTQRHRSQTVVSPLPQIAARHLEPSCNNVVHRDSLGNRAEFQYPSDTTI